MAGNDGALTGLRLLVVEDDAMLAFALEMALMNFGCEGVSLAGSLGEAMALARDVPVDGAILDVNLAGQRVFPVADILAGRDIPYLFATGYGADGLRDCDRSRPVLQKPYEFERLAAIVRQWRRGSRESAPAAPRPRDG